MFFKSKFSNRKNTIFFKLAPPHGLTPGDSFQNGCPNGHDPLKIVKQMAENGITLYTVGCEPAITPYKDFFTAIAYTTGNKKQWFKIKLY